MNSMILNLQMIRVFKSRRDSFIGSEIKSEHLREIKLIFRHVIVNNIERILLTDSDYNIITTRRETLLDYALADYIRNVDIFTGWDVLFLIFILCVIGVYLTLLSVNSIWIHLVFYIKILTILIAYIIYRCYYTPSVNYFDPDSSRFLLEYEYEPLP